MEYRGMDLDNDYPELVKLWDKSQFEVAPPKDMLADLGIIAFDQTKIRGAVFIWLTIHSKVALIGFPILDEDYREEDRSEVLKTLFRSAETVAKHRGYIFSFHYSGLEHMVNFLKSEGYIVGDRNVTNLIKGL